MNKIINLISKIFWFKLSSKLNKFTLFILIESESLSVMSDSLWPPHRLYSPGNSPGQNTRMGSLPFSRESFQPGDRTEVSHIAGGFFTSWATRGSPRMLGWIDYPFSSGFSRPRNGTGVSCIAGEFFTNWAIRELIWG